MKIWLSKNSEVSLSDQLVEQVMLGIASHDLKVGEKLPSTRELARRFGIHQNTVIAAYRRLAETGLVEFKKGSGVYVTAVKKFDENSNGLASIVDRFVSEAATSGYSLTDIIEHLRSRVDAKPSRFLLVESDVELQKILVAEIEAVTGCSVDSITFEDFSTLRTDGELQVTAFTRKSKVANACSPARKSISLRPNSVPASLSGRSRPADSDLIAVVSGWEKFLALAKLFLLAVNIDSETIIVRSPGVPDWKSGLQTASLVICDSLSANEFPDDARVRIFPLISEDSIAQLRSAI